MNNTNIVTAQTSAEINVEEVATTTPAQAPEVVKPRFIPPQAVHIHTNSWGHHVYIAKTTDGTYQNIRFYIVDTEWCVSEPITKKKSQLMKKNGFEFFLDLNYDFDKADIDAIKAVYIKRESTLTAIDCPERVHFKQVYKGLYLYRNGLKDDIITLDREGDLEYLCIDTKHFDSLVKAEDWGWNPLEVKRHLRQLGFLRINMGRPYDFAKRDKDGNPYRTISLRLDAELGEEV